MLEGVGVGGRGGLVGLKGSLFKWTYKRTGLRGHHRNEWSDLSGLLFLKGQMMVKSSSSVLLYVQRR